MAWATLILPVQAEQRPEGDELPYWEETPDVVEAWDAAERHIEMHPEELEEARVTALAIT